MTDDLNEILSAIERLEAEVRDLCAPRPSLSALRRGLPVLLVAAAASWVVAQSIDFRSDDNGTERVRLTIEKNGAPTGTDASAYFTRVNLGIGTSAPAALVDVTGTDPVGIRYLKTGSKDARIWVGDSTQTWGLSSGWATAGDFSLIEELVSGNRLYLQQGTGNLGIGTSAPTEKLTVVGDMYVNGQLRIGNLAASPTSFGKGCLFYGTASDKIYVDDGAWTDLSLGPGGGASSGTIILWSPLKGAIPAGWVLCDGTLGTPNLRDKFVVGAGGLYAVGDQGGSASHAHTVDLPDTTSTSVGHSHTTTATAGTAWTSALHSHDFNPPSTGTSGAGDHQHGGGSLFFNRVHNPWNGAGTSARFLTLAGAGFYANRWYFASWSASSDWGGSHSHSFNYANVRPGDSSHNHTLTVTVSGASAPSVTHTHDTDPAPVASAAPGTTGLPAYYSLVYIMKQ